MTTRPNADLLAAIVGATRRIVETRREIVSAQALERHATERQPQAREFRDALRRPDRVNVIAECKRRSPSKGVLRQDYDPVAIAGGYARAGAAALSVLTEPTFFDGSLEHLKRVRATVSIPLLRKDFIVDEYQLLEARAAGADAVLLIVAALDDGALAHLQHEAVELGLATLVEVHDVDELSRAVDAGADIVGVNNRNLRTLEVDVRASHDIAARMPAHVTAVSESGLRTAANLHSLRDLGYHAFLIGERFMATADPGQALADLLTAVPGGSQDPPLPQDGNTHPGSAASVTHPGSAGSSTHSGRAGSSDDLGSAGSLDPAKDAHSSSAGSLDPANERR